MARIKTGAPGGMLRRFAERQYGYMPGLTQVIWPDKQTTIGAGLIYNHLHLGRSSRLTRLQREMVATVVNGKIGGAP